MYFGYWAYYFAGYLGDLYFFMHKVYVLDLRKCNLPEDLAHDGSKWWNRIHVDDPTLLGQDFDDDKVYISYIV